MKYQLCITTSYYQLFQFRQQPAQQELVFMLVRTVEHNNK